MNNDRGQIGQGGSGNRSEMSGSGGLDYSQPQWDVPKDALRDQITNLDNFVVIGTRQGKAFVASTQDKFAAQQLLKTHAPDLIPQNA